MNIRLFAVVLVIACASASFGAVTQLPQTKTASYEGWGFKLQVPQTARRVPVPAMGEVEIWDLHVYGDLAYFVKVVKVAQDTLSSTAIEQEIQAESNVSAKRGETRRWEMDSGFGELFKGLSYFSKPEEDLPEAAMELQKVLRGRTGFISSAWGPLKGDSGPILIVGVIGPKGRDAEIDNLAKFLVGGVARIKPAVPDVVPPAPVSKPKPPPVAITPAAKPLPVLKKGDIKIVGVVESLAMDRKCLTMKADEITLFGGSAVRLEPPRSKVVNLVAPAMDVAMGDRVIVVGKNTGVGKPMQAAAIVKAP